MQVLHLRTVRPELVHEALEEHISTSRGGTKPFMERPLFTAWPKPARVSGYWPAEDGLMELSEENRRGAAPNIGGWLAPAS